MRKKIVAGNWKMNTLPAEGVELAKQVAAGKHTVCDCVSFIVCPPFTHLSEVSKTLEGTGIAVGAQNCAAEAKGAYTGEVAASMIAALGCKYVILGHSERRQYYGETSETLNRKMEQAYANDLVPIYCVGENLDEREAGKHFDVVKAQIEEVVYNLTPEQFGKLVIAYEPVWAIGTGKTATAEQAQEIHAYIRKVLAAKFGAAAEECPILYGGSCKPSNAAEIFAKENTLEALREAIEARRTLAYSFGTIAGDEQLLKDLFTASVRTSVLHTDAKGRRTVSLTNNSSVQYVLRLPGQNPFILNPFSTVTTTVAQNRPLRLTVENMWYSEQDHPQIELML